MRSPASPALRRTLRGSGVVIEAGPFLIRLRSRLRAVAEAVALHYERQLRPPQTPFCDFHIRIDRAPGLRGWWRPQARFHLDGATPFRPLPLCQAYPLFEWGLNWCIAQHGHRFLMLHAAVVARNGAALILPGAPGAGKSTLCAALSLSGWRLLSDEFALIALESGQVTPLPRPVSLKEGAIDLIADHYPAAAIGARTHDTSKGTVAHLKPPSQSVAQAEEPARPTWLLFPAYAPDAIERLKPLSRGDALLRLADAAFNYSLLGARGFTAAADLVERCSVHTLQYRDLDSALTRIDRLTGATPA